MKNIKCKFGNLVLNDRQEYYLDRYKKSGSDLDTSLSYKNLNLFLNFLNNPKSISITSLEVNIDTMVRSIKELIDLSCENAILDGNVDTYLVRYEDERNIDGYNDGYLTSLKSTSYKPNSVKMDFGLSKGKGHGNIVPLLYKISGFCPYINVDKIVDGKMFSNEGEYLFPPFINCLITEDYQDYRNMNEQYRVVRIYDKFEDGQKSEVEKNYQSYNANKDSFQTIFNRDKKSGIISEELIELTKTIRDYLFSYAREKYKEYKELYNKKYKDQEKIITLWPKEYNGLESAIINHFDNKGNEMPVMYALDSLVIQSNFIPEYILKRAYELQEPYVIEHYLKNRLEDDMFLSLSDEEYKEFLKLFNIANGQNENHTVGIAEMRNAVNKIYDFMYEKSKDKERDILR